MIIVKVNCMQPRTNRSLDALYAFLFSLFYILIYCVAFILLVEPLHDYFPIQPLWLENGIHLLLISLTGTLICCTVFFAANNNPILVPKGFSFLLAYLLLTYASVFLVAKEAEQHNLLIRIITLYAAAPTIVGNVVSWPVYSYLKRKKK